MRDRAVTQGNTGKGWQASRHLSGF